MIVATLFVVSVIAILLFAQIWSKRIAKHVVEQEAIEAAKTFQLEIIAKAAAMKLRANAQAEEDKAAVREMDAAELERKVNE